MRKNALPITAGVLGSLALGVSASADFIGFQTEMKGTYDTAAAFGGPDVGLVDVWNLYAMFDSPNDSLTAIFVDPDHPNANIMTHSSDVTKPFDGLGNGFWNWQLGLQTPLDADGAYVADPAAGDADTYITIGLKAGTFPKGGDASLFPPGSAGVLADSGILNGSGSITDQFGFAATPDDAQTYPIDGRVLVLQVAVRSGEHASGVWNFRWGTGEPGAGGGLALGVAWSTIPIPAPGAMALLSLAGLASTRNRRRKKTNWSASPRAAGAATQGR